MPDRIPVISDRIAVQSGGVSRFEAPRAADAGGAISSVGKSLMQASEPYLSAEAEKKAREAVGSVTLVKDGDGYRTAEAMPAGAGLIYRKVYERGVEQLLLQRTTKDFEIDLARLQANHIDDPEGFLAAAQGRGEGYLKAALPTIRAELDANLAREVGERFRGLADNKARRDHANLIKGLEDGVAVDLETIAILAEDPTPEKIARIAELTEAAKAKTETLHGLGAFNDAGADAQKRHIENAVGGANELGQSIAFLRKVGPFMQGMSDEDLARLALFGDGLTDGGKITFTDEEGKSAEVDLDTFRGSVPNRQVAAAISAQADKALSLRIAKRNAEAEAAREEERLRIERETQATAEATLRAIRDGSHDPVNGYSKGEVAAIEQRIASRGSVHDQMATKEGRLALLADVSTYGFMPEGLAEYLDGQITGENFEAVTGFISSLREFNANGAHAGQLAYEQLDAKTRAFFEYDEVLRRMGKKPEERLAILQDARRGRTFTEGEARAAFPKERGLTYDAVRQASLLRAFGWDEDRAPMLRGNPAIMRDYDTTLRFNLQIYGGDTAAAAKATATAVRQAWAPNPRFIGGMAPRALNDAWARNNILIADLQAVLPQADLKGATLANGRIRFRPLNDNPTKTLGNYWMQIYDAAGNQVGGQQVKMNDITRDAAARAKARAGTKAEADRQRAAAENRAERERLRAGPRQFKIRD